MAEPAKPLKRTKKALRKPPTVKLATVYRTDEQAKTFAENIHRLAKAITTAKLVTLLQRDGEYSSTLVKVNRWRENGMRKSPVRDDIETLCEIGRVEDTEDWWNKHLEFPHLQQPEKEPPKPELTIQEKVFCILESDRGAELIKVINRLYSKVAP